MQPLSTSAPSGTTQPCARPLQARPGAAWLLGLAVAATLAAPAQLQARDFASTQAQPRTEHWQRRQADIDTQLQDTAALPAYRLVFVGDSITDFWLFDNNPWGKGRYGRRIWDESFGGRDPANRALNLGISGDRLEHVLHRLKPRAEGGLGVLDAPGLKPEFLVVLIGINNTWAGEEPLADSVFAGVQAVLTSLRQRQPQVGHQRKALVLQEAAPRRGAAGRFVGDEKAQEAALRRVSFEEFFLFQVSVILRRLSIVQKEGYAHRVPGDLARAFGAERVVAGGEFVSVAEGLALMAREGA